MIGSKSDLLLRIASFGADEKRKRGGILFGKCVEIRLERKGSLVLIANKSVFAAGSDRLGVGHVGHNARNSASAALLCRFVSDTGKALRLLFLALGIGLYDTAGGINGNDTGNSELHCLLDDVLEFIPLGNGLI